MKQIKTLIVQFNNEIAVHEISSFRGAVIAAMGQANILFHNHLDDSFRYSYPLIQYKRIHKCAAIVCVNEGTEAIGQLFSEGNFDFRLGERTVRMEVGSVRPLQYNLQCWKSLFHYSLRKWLPLNSDNYHKYMELEALGDKVGFLEKILVANILSFCKCMQFFLDEEMECHITRLGDTYTLRHKGVKMLSMDVEFMCNVSLPDFIGIGKNASMGSGVVTRIKNIENRKYK